ncbi:MAG: cyclic nucleotide-binding domain-containing protein [Candidatus Latescibacterota bacterium]|jgi:CRP-like cAMP-binding protein
MSKTAWGIDKFDLFKGLNAMEIQEVAKISNKVHFNKNEIIASETDVTRDIFILIAGSVEIISFNGVPLYRIASGEIFGELAFVPSLKRTAIALTREDSWVLVMNINHLEKLGEEYPDIYKKISNNLVTSIGIKLARANKLIELLKTELSKSLKSRS